MQGNLIKLKFTPNPNFRPATLDSVELFLNGASLGSRKVSRNSHVEWNVKYVPGVLEARG
jgi:hypothetical protein